MENDLPRSGDIINGESPKKIPYDPDQVFRNKNVAYFGAKENFKIQYKEFAYATGARKWINSVVVVIVFLLVEAVIIANFPPARSFVVSFFSLDR